MTKKYKILTMYSEYFKKILFVFAIYSAKLYTYTGQRTLNSTKCISMHFVLHTIITFNRILKYVFLISVKLTEIFQNIAKNAIF